MDMPVTITDVIRRNTDGKGRITVTTGDASVPCIGIYSPACRKTALLYTVQEVKGCQPGLSCQDGILEIQYPYFRKGKQYRAFCTVEKSDPGRNFTAGEVLEIPYRLYEWDCGGMEEFYHTFFITWKWMLLFQKFSLLKNSGGYREKSLIRLITGKREAFKKSASRRKPPRYGSQDGSAGECFIMR